MSTRYARLGRHPAVRVGLVALLACATPACDLESELQPDPDTVAAADILDLTRTGGDLPILANGAGIDTLVARIPRGASDRWVTFTTSRASLLARPGLLTVRVRAEETADRHDRRLVARVVLFGDTIAAPVVASAAVGPYTDYVVVPFVK